MSVVQLESEPRKKSGKPPVLMGCCIALPLLLLSLTALTYWNNNRSPQIVVPMPKMPSPNAYDDFVRAGTLAIGVQHKSPFSLPNPTYTFAEFKAAAKDAQPVLTVMRQGFGKEY